MVAKQFSVGVGELNHDTAFINDLGADSLDLGELEMALEDEFEGLEIDVEAASINNVGQLVDYIITNIKEVPA